MDEILQVSILIAVLVLKMICLEKSKLLWKDSSMSKCQLPGS